MTGATDLTELVDAIRKAPAYRRIEPGLVARLAGAELSKGRTFKEAVKAVRGKLHQVAGAYLADGLELDAWAAELALLSHDRHDPALRAWCQSKMSQHASTRERLPTLAEFYAQTLAGLGALHSILDLGCGLNPLALPWMNLAPDAAYYGCDLYGDLAGFGDAFRQHLGLGGAVVTSDLTTAIPNQPVQLALALKLIPCLEQLDKTIGSRLLTGVNTEHLLVSFPARSLGGRAKGMGRTYESHFLELTAGQDWQVQRFAFPNELAFLLSRPRMEPA
ncbi:MAG: 16S rRNA methyltransferase [Anaerolineae bacterium]|nr:16S rRNA methyltransferase [Anaerolineae bacterium]